MAMGMGSYLCSSTKWLVSVSIFLSPARSAVRGFVDPAMAKDTKITKVVMRYLVMTELSEDFLGYDLILQRKRRLSNSA